MFKIASSFFFPTIILFAVYIQINGESSPGGGFQAGAILASIIIGYDLIFKKNVIDKEYMYSFAILGVMLYIATGFAAILFGYNFLDYNFLSTNHKIAQSIGIFIIEAGVFLTVSCGLSSIYFALSKD